MIGLTSIKISVYFKINPVFNAVEVEIGEEGTKWREKLHRCCQRSEVMLSRRETGGRMRNYCSI